MGIFIQLIAVAAFLVAVWYLRLYLKETIEYKEARRAEVKRRLQVEHKQEQALKTALAQSLDDNERFKLEIRAAHERHQRAINYVIADMFDRQQ